MVMISLMMSGRKKHQSSPLVIGVRLKMNSAEEKYRTGEMTKMIIIGL